ncbi:MAG: AAA family ATPase [Solirubrobacterales bacterium]
MIVGNISWPVVGAGIGVAAGLIALATAVLNHRIARENLHSVLRKAEEVPREGTAKVYLPARAHFVNRKAEMDRAIMHIRSGEVALAIEGDIGVGKSATATELAHRLHSEDVAGGAPADADDRTYIWIDSRDDCPPLSDVCRALSLFTGDQSLSRVAESHKLDALRAHLAKHQTVLVLDNLRLGDDLRSQQIRELVRTVPPGSLVIASVNTPGSLDAVRLSLEDLSAPDVEQLVRHEVNRLGLSDPALLEASFVNRLQEIVGGNPGMIEWFLRSFSRGEKSLEAQLVAVSRGEGLGALLTPMWTKLSPSSRMVLGVCANLRGQATIEQATTASELPEEEVSAAVRGLLSVGLLRTVRATDRPTLFVCASGVQRFVIAQTPAERRAEFTARLASYYTDYFSRNWEDARTAVSHMNGLRATIANLHEEGREAQLQQLFGNTLDLFFTLGLFDDRIELGGLAYESAIRSGDHRAASLACSVISSTHAIRGELTAAREALALGLIAAERSGAAAEKARQMRDTGFIHYRSGEAGRALVAVEGADELALANGDLNNRVDVIGVQMASYWYLGRLDEAERAAHRYIRACEDIPWERAQANAMRYLAEAAIHRRDFDIAREHLKRARHIAERYDDARGLMRLRMTEARLCLIALTLREAEGAAADAEESAIALGLPSEQVESAALRKAARRARLIPPLRLYLRRRRPLRMTDEPVGGD